MPGAAYINWSPADWNSGCTYLPYDGVDGADMTSARVKFKFGDDSSRSAFIWGMAVDKAAFTADVKLFLDVIIIRHMVL